MWYCKFILETIWMAQKKMDIPHSRVSPLCEILQYDLPRDCPLFDEAGFARHKKHEIIENVDLKEEDYKLNWNDDVKTVVVVDFMPMVRKVPVSCSWKHKRGFRVKMGGNDIIQLT